MVFVLSIVLTICVTVCASQTVDVAIPELGTLQGSDNQSPIPVERMVKFLGVPYAQPPTGSRRFQPPEAISRWSGTKVATSFGNKCPQVSFSGAVSGDEDCLYLNIYVPGDLSGDVRFPVMIYIHGGGFKEGSGEDWEADELVRNQDHNVVLVTVNYRLGIMGFLSSGDDVIKGNMGLKDQAMAIDWVKKYITNFNGDPDRVTLFGHSAGGESIKAHILSSYSTGKFQRAIIQSGTVLWKLPDKQTHAEDFTAFALHMGCANGDSTSFKTCLDGKTSNEILTNDFPNSKRFIMRVIDGEFFTQSIEQIMANDAYDKVDLIVGFNTDDADFLHTNNAVGVDISRGISANNQETDGFFNYALGVALSELGTYSDATLDHLLVEERIINAIQLRDRAKNNYLTPGLSDLETARKISHALRDVLFVSHSLAMADMLASHGKKTYVYHFNERTDDLAPSDPNEVQVIAGHRSPLPYLFDMDSPVLDSQEMVIKQSMLEAWTTFAESGMPQYIDLGRNSHTWTQYSPENQNILKIDEESLRSAAVENREAVWGQVKDFWVSSIRNNASRIVSSTEDPITDPRPAAQESDDDKFKTDILKLDEFEADLTIIILAVIGFLLLITVIILWCKIACKRKRSSDEEKYAKY